MNRCVAPRFVTVEVTAPRSMSTSSVSPSSTRDAVVACSTSILLPERRTRMASPSMATTLDPRASTADDRSATRSPFFSTNTVPRTVSATTAALASGRFDGGTAATEPVPRRNHVAAPMPRSNTAAATLTSGSAQRRRRPRCADRASSTLIASTVRSRSSVDGARASISSSARSFAAARASLGAVILRLPSRPPDRRARRRARARCARHGDHGRGASARPRR